MFSPPPGGATEYIAYRSARCMDFARATITRDIFIPGPKQCGLRGFAKLKKFQKSKNNLEVGGWVQVPFG